MLTTYPEQSRKSGRDHGSAATWLDLVDPNDEELERAAKLLGDDLPTREQVSAIELSSRVRVGDEFGMLSGNVPVRHENIRIGIPAESYFGIRECEHVLFTVLIFPFNS